MAMAMAAFPAPAFGGGFGEPSKIASALAETSIIIHCPPDMPQDAEILGVLGVSEKYATAHQYGWMVTDFLAWKIIFQGVGNKSAKHWLSTIDIATFANANGMNLDDGNTRDSILGGDGNDITKVPCSNEPFMLNLQVQIAARAQAADDRKTNLAIIIFSPVTPESDICVDLGPAPNKTFFTTELIRETIRKAVNHDKLPVTLVTVSPFTGGWVCYPSLFPMALRTSNPELIRLVAKSCGGVFADTFVGTFTKRSTPLLTESERTKVRYDDMMPVGPTNEQTALLHRFQRDIHECLEQRFCDLAKKHGLDFQPAHDTWSTFCPRHGYDLAWWKEKWGAPEDMEVDDEVDRFEFLGDTFGGSRHSQVFHLKYLAAIEADTCPGDWSRNMTGITNPLLSSFVQDPTPNDEQFKRVFDAIEFRGSLMILANILVKALKLSMPGAKCRFWEDKVGEDHLYSKLQAAFADVHNLFSKAPLLPGEIRHAFKNVRFYRPARWISAAIALKFEHHPNDDIKAFIVKEVAPFIAELRATQLELLREHPAIVSMGKAWIASLNLGIDTNTIRVSGKEKTPTAVTETTSQSLPAPAGRANEKMPVAVMSKSCSVGRELLETMDRKDRIKLKLEVIEDRKSQTAEKIGHHQVSDKPKALPVQEQGVTQSPEAIVRDTDEMENKAQALKKPLETSWDAFYKKLSEAPNLTNLAPTRALKQAASAHWGGFIEAPVQSVAEHVIDLPGVRIGIRSPKTTPGLSKEIPKLVNKLSETSKDMVSKAIGEPIEKVEEVSKLTDKLDEVAVKTKKMAISPVPSPVSAQLPTPKNPVLDLTPLGLTMAAPLMAPVATSPARTTSSRMSSNSAALIAGLREINNILAEDPQKVLEVLRGLNRITNTETKAKMAAGYSLENTNVEFGGPLAQTPTAERKASDVVELLVIAQDTGYVERTSESAGEMTEANTTSGIARLTPPQTPVNVHSRENTQLGNLSGEADEETDISSSNVEFNIEVIENQEPTNTAHASIEGSEKAGSGSGPKLAGNDFWEKVAW